MRKPRKPQEIGLSGLFYLLQGKSLLMKLDLKRKLDKNRGITINLMGIINRRLSKLCQDQREYRVAGDADQK